MRIKSMSPYYYTLGVSGSRDYTDETKILGELIEVQAYIDDRGFQLFIKVGDCPGGVDLITKEWCLERKIEHQIYKAWWDSCMSHCPSGHRVKKKPGDIFHPGKKKDYCPWAGPDRNKKIIKSGIDQALIIRQNNSSGATNFHHLAMQYNVPRITLINV